MKGKIFRIIGSVGEENPPRTIIEVEISGKEGQELTLGDVEITQKGAI